MRNKRSLYRIVTLLIAAVWFINGLICKVLNLVPRHQEIVSQILGNTHAAFFTKAIGIAEIGMVIWIITGFKSRLNAAVQIMIIATMNIIEFIMVPELLLFGKYNLLLALLFIGLIYYNEFVLNKK